MAGSAAGGGTGIVPLAGTTGNTAGTLIGLDDSALGSGGRLGVGGVITGAAAGALVMGISGGGLPLVGSLLGHWPAIATRPPSDTPRTPAIIFQRDNSMVQRSSTRCNTQGTREPPRPRGCRTVQGNQRTA
jgi:hypothetical protein